MPILHADGVNRWARVKPEPYRRRLIGFSRETEDEFEAGNDGSGEPEESVEETDAEGVEVEASDEEED